MLEQLAPLIMVPFMIAMLGFFIRSVCQLIIFLDELTHGGIPGLISFFCAQSHHHIVAVLYAVNRRKLVSYDASKDCSTFDMLGWLCLVCWSASVPPTTNH